MINVNNFISEHITGRQQSMLASDIAHHREQLTQEIEGKSVLVIGGAGTIGSSYIRAVLPFKPSKLVVVDISENGLTELTRDLRSTHGMFVPEDYRTYPLNFADPIFEKIFRAEGGFDVVANFSAHKHVRSEKDQYSVEALVENNVLKARKLLDLLVEFPPKHFFCVSTDKAANPVNIMGCSKKVMEEMIMAYSKQFKITTARFANVAFSNGSLLAGFIERMMKQQPLSAPNDVKRYFVSPDESGQICMLACMLGKSGEIFFPKLGAEHMMTFSSIADKFLEAMGYTPIKCNSDEEARGFFQEKCHGAIVTELHSEENRTTMQPNNYVTDAKHPYPVFYFGSDTTGEKGFEEFYIEGEQLNMERFASLGVIEEYACKDIAEIDRFFHKMTVLFERNDFTKADIVVLLKEIVPNFEHEEKGKNLDQKM